MALLTLFLWLLFFLILIIILKKKKSGNETQNKLQHPPSPPKLPIIGNLHQLGGLLHQSLCQLSRKYGPVMLLHLGSVPSVVISSADAAKQALKTHDLDCCSRPSLAGQGRLSYNYLDISFTPYSDYWREIRKLSVLELFSMKRVLSFRSIREEEVGFFVDFVSRSAKSSTPVNLTKEFYILTANITLRMAFGTTLGATGFDKDRFRKVVTEAQALLGSFSANEYFPFVGWIVDRLTGYHAWTERVFHELDAFFQQVIDDHDGMKPCRRDQREEDIVDLLLRIEREQSGFGAARLSKKHIKAVLMDIFLAGVDTGAITLTWAMAELVRNPRVMKIAQNEVRNIIRNRERVSEIDTNELQYLKMVIKETLRLHPPIPLLLPREAMSHFNLNNYDIRPKTMIQVNVWAIGRDPNSWKDPEVFFPERFLDGSIDFKGQNFEFLPFGAGRRSCPGNHMAMVMLELVLANLLHCFNWDFPDGVEDIDMAEEGGLSLTASKKEDLCLVPVKYLHDLSEDT